MGSASQTSGLVLLLFGFSAGSPLHSNHTIPSFLSFFHPPTISKLQSCELWSTAPWSKITFSFRRLKFGTQINSFLEISQCRKHESCGNPEHLVFWGLIWVLLTFFAFEEDRGAKACFFLPHKQFSKSQNLRSFCDFCYRLHLFQGSGEIRGCKIFFEVFSCSFLQVSYRMMMSLAQAGNCRVCGHLPGRGQLWQQSSVKSLVSVPAPMSANPGNIFPLWSISQISYLVFLW